MNILFICVGNTCRSPMAEALLRDAAKARGRADIVTLSAGIAAAVGAPATAAAQAVMQRCGIDISAHRSRQLSVFHVDAADQIVVMTDDIAQVLREHFSESKEKIFTLAEWSGIAGDLKDPFGGDEKDYEVCATALRNRIDRWFAKGN